MIAVITKFSRIGRNGINIYRLHDATPWRSSVDSWKCNGTTLPIVFLGTSPAVAKFHRINETFRPLSSGVEWIPGKSFEITARDRINACEREGTCVYRESREDFSIGSVARGKEYIILIADGWTDVPESFVSELWWFAGIVKHLCLRKKYRLSVKSLYNFKNLLRRQMKRQLSGNY